jgi:hypothetical protein
MDGRIANHTSGDAQNKLTTASGKHLLRATLLVHRFAMIGQNDVQTRSLLMRFRRNLSLDWWSVLIALSAAALIRFGLVPHIPW